MENANKPEAKRRNKASAEKYRNSEAGKRKTLDSRLRREYGISLEKRDSLIKANGNVCPICKTFREGEFWAVDHCHRTGKVRGVICHKCNKMLGLANDNISRLLSAIKYLNDHYLNQAPAEGIVGVPKPEEELEGEAQ